MSAKLFYFLTFFCMHLIRKPQALSRPLSPWQLMDDLLDTSFRPSSWMLAREEMMNFPKIDIHQTKEEVVLSADIPGFRPEDIDVQVEDKTISISGKTEETKEESEKHFLLKERSIVSFDRSFQLPVSVNPQQVKATFKNGTLVVNMPKVLEKNAEKIKISIEN